MSPIPAAVRLIRWGLLVWCGLAASRLCAQDAPCPRLWRADDRLHTDSAAAVRWFRNDTLLPHAATSLAPDSAGSYRVEAFSLPSSPLYIELPCSRLLLAQVFPIPIRRGDSLVVRKGTDRAIPYELADLSGRAVLRGTLTQPEEHIALPWSVSSGIYLLNLHYATNCRQVQKVAVNE